MVSSTNFQNPRVLLFGKFLIWHSKILNFNHYYRPSKQLTETFIELHKHYLFHIFAFKSLCKHLFIHSVPYCLDDCNELTFENINNRFGTESQSVLWRHNGQWLFSNVTNAQGQAVSKKGFW